MGWGIGIICVIAVIIVGVAIATKADKIAKTKTEEYIKEIRKSLFAKEEIIPFSSDKKINVDIICDKIIEFAK